MNDKKHRDVLTSADILKFQAILLQKNRELHDYHTLRDIQEALERIEEGTYGICWGTGKPIGKKRLTAIPWTKYSFEYASLIERGLEYIEDAEEAPDGPGATAA